MNFIVVGITDSPQPFFPPEVLQAISSGSVFSGGRRHHEIVAPLLPAGSQWIDITVPLDKVFEQYKTVGCESVVVFASGDPLFFGFANTIKREMPEAGIKVFPTFNSLQMLAHRLVLPYHDMRTVSLTGRPWHEFDRALIECCTTIGVLTDREHTPAAIARRMLDYGYTYYNMYVGEHLGNPSLERVSTLTLEEACFHDFSQPNSIILSCPPPCAGAGPVPARTPSTAGEGSVSACTPSTAAADNRVCPRKKPFGIPDADFLLLDGREKMITKMPIRLLTLQALDLANRRVLWDIGACTGSVSIEARLRFPHLHVVAFEVRPQCEAIILENARRHGAPGIEVVMGDFRSVGCGLPAPDAVFIGGHGGHLKEIMTKVLSVIAPGGIIVMNSVSSPVVSQMTDRPSSRQLWDETCRELGLKQQPPLHIQLNEYNPIELLSVKCQ